MVLADVVLKGLELLLLASFICFVVGCVLAVIRRTHAEAFAYAGGALFVLAVLLG